MTKTTVYKIYGPPGTGKTFFLKEKMRELLAGGFHPGEIVAVSFTRSAAYELRERAIAAFPEYDPSDFKVGTIHSLCLKLLGISASQLFVDRQLHEFAKIWHYELSDEDTNPLEQNIQDCALNTAADYFEFFVKWQANKMLYDFDTAYHEFINQQTDLPDGFNQKALAEYIERRQSYKEDNALWDFSDLIYACLHKGLYPKTMRVLIVDEAQDSSPILWALLRFWVSKSEQVYIAGDVYQSVYGWCGAEPSLMLEFPCDEQLTLGQSYRCSRAIHDLARTIVENRFTTRYPDDDFKPTEQKGEVIRGPVRDFDSDGSCYYLFRTRYLLNRTYDELIRYRVPFVTKRGKVSPLDDRKGNKKTAIKSLYLLYNGEKVSLLDFHKLLQYIPARGFIEHGEKGRFQDYCVRNPELKIGLHDLLFLGFTPRFIDTVKRQPLDVLTGFSTDEKSYLLDVIDIYGESILSKPIGLCLSTYHASKGLESDSVIINPDYTKRPYSRLLAHDEEEHRLFYVAVTRARRKAIILPPSSRNYYPL